MDYRKIIQFGKTSFVISLPKQWVRKNNLSKGDLISLMQEKDNLVVCARERKKIHEASSVTVNTETKELPEIKAEIVSAYLANHDVITVKGRNLADLSIDIKKIVRDLMGFEMVEQEAGRIVAKDLMNTEEVDVGSLIRRVDIIVRSMIKDSTAGLHEDYYESIFHRDKDVNKLVLMLKRVIKLALDEPYVASKMKKGNKELLRDWNIVCLLESVGDEVKRVSRIFRKMEKGKNKIKEANKILGEKYFEIMRAYHKKDLKLAMKINLGHSERMKMIDELKAEGNLLYHLKSLNSCLKNMSRVVEW